MRIPPTAMNASNRIIRRHPDFYLKHNKFARALAHSSGEHERGNDKGRDRITRNTTKKYTNKSAPSGMGRFEGVSRAQLRAVTLAALACRRYRRKRITLAFKRHVITFRRINGIWSIFNFLRCTHTHIHVQDTQQEREHPMRGGGGGGSCVLF